jgi:hypothetical protein
VIALAGGMAFAPPSQRSDRCSAFKPAILLISMTQSGHLRRIRFWLAVFIIGLVLSGITAFPLETELSWLVSILHAGWLRPISEFTGLSPWIERVNDALRNTNTFYPFLAYGTDWLAFAHLVIAVAFIGPYIDPVRNKWVITFGLIACAGVVPLALIAGAIRGMPFPWRLIDCNFGIFGAIPLSFSRQSIRALERE